jgi:hypothetical protein
VVGTGRRTMVAAAVLVIAVACGEAAPAAPPEVQLSEMDSYGCGYGFWLGTPEQDVAVVLAVTDHEAASMGDVPERVSIPDDAWDATVLAGRDLFSNWCDDVLEPDEPEAVTREEWEITGGTITLHHPAPELGCQGGLTATLQGLEATRSDGTTVDLGDREVTNETWGCFAG